MPNKLYEFSVRRIDGQEESLGVFEGSVLLIVNTASRCGFTPQYEGLERLHRRFQPRGFSVLGFPCNQFGAQEPGDAQAITQFCRMSYDVTFPLFSKIDVNGADTHPLYAYLKAKRPGLLGIEAIKWNFTKFLVARDGAVVDRFAPTTKPDALMPEIEALL